MAPGLDEFDVLLEVVLSLVRVLKPLLHYTKIRTVWFYQRVMHRKD